MIKNNKIVVLNGLICTIYVHRTVLVAIRMLAIINISNSSNSTTIIMVPLRWSVRKASKGNETSGREMVIHRYKERSLVKILCIT